MLGNRAPSSGGNAHVQTRIAREPGLDPDFHPRRTSFQSIVGCPHVGAESELPGAARGGRRRGGTR